MSAYYRKRSEQVVAVPLAIDGHSIERAFHRLVVHTHTLYSFYNTNSTDYLATIIELNIMVVKVPVQYRFLPLILVVC
jgi:hypothetical protein